MLSQFFAKVKQHTRTNILPPDSITLIRTITILGTISISISLLSNLYNNNLFLTVINSICLLVAAFILILILKGIKEDIIVFAFLLPVSILLTFLFLNGGASDTGHLWYFICPLLVLFLLKLKIGSIYLGIMSIPILIHILKLPTDPRWMRSYESGFVVRFLICFTLVSIFAFLYEATSESIKKDLLLKNNELKDIIAKLKKTEKTLIQLSLEHEEKITENQVKLSDLDEQIKATIKERQSLKLDA